ncbi:uncharacterized protein SPSC_04535 [Sporisorium scitamineum]|uniref:Tyrosinase copper-binding domain-containing protein n=1 Tax=Sporisorium scitamineum TaxID=49012 RepID=A0A0F7RY93_9BASI|nr:hypothetical protein [Sporisorium scitamineum]CDU24702.1 uncharacterized protein SPSC_04535 [Sporisorium scitamineum]
MATPYLLLLLLMLCWLQLSLAKETSFWSSIHALEARSTSHSSHPPHPLRRDTPTPAGHTSVKCTRPVARVSFYALTPAEQSAWIHHFHLLHTPGRSIFIKGGSYMDDLVMVHIGLQEEMHYNACFLVCHTAFLRAFYTLMRVTGYRGREAYWDIEHDWRHGMQNSPLWRLFGGDDGRGGAIPNGPFRNLRCGVLPNTKKPGYSLVKPHYVTRHFNSNWLHKPLSRGDMYTHAYNTSLYNQILTAPTYTKLRTLLETSLHAWTHQSIGGEMWLYSSPCEPTFWLLHAEVDRCWRSWQLRTGKYFEYGGHKRIRKVGASAGATVIKEASLEDTVDFYGLFEKVKVADVMHPRRGIMCFRYDRLLGGELDTGG